MDGLAQPRPSPPATSTTTNTTPHILSTQLWPPRHIHHNHSTQRSQGTNILPILSLGCRTVRRKYYQFHSTPHSPQRPPTHPLPTPQPLNETQVHSTPHSPRPPTHLLSTPQTLNEVQVHFTPHSPPRVHDHQHIHYRDYNQPRSQGTNILFILSLGCRIVRRNYYQVHSALHSPLQPPTQPPPTLQPLNEAQLHSTASTPHSPPPTHLLSTPLRVYVLVTYI